MMNDFHYENPWLYNGEPFYSHNIAKYFGFVYCITDNINGKKYIGRKYFWSKRKDKKTAKKVKKESDWKTYYGSSDLLKEEILCHGKEHFKREILSLHLTQGSVNYTEIEEQFVRNVVSSDEYYNESINGKFHNVRLDGRDFSNVLIHTENWRKAHSEFMSRYNLGRIKITNGTKNRYINPDKDQIPVGWYRGTTVSPEGKIKRSIGLKKAWEDGSFDQRPKPKPLSTETKKKIALAQTGEKNHRYGKKNSSLQTEAITKSVKSTKWINDGVTNKRVPETILDFYLNDGWVLGAIQKH